MHQNTITETGTGWQNALDKRFVNRITRPLLKQGVINNVLSRSILSRYTPLIIRHPILNRTLQRLSYSEIAGIKKVPIIYRVQQGTFDLPEGGTGLSRESSSIGKGAAISRMLPEHPKAKKSAEDQKFNQNSGGVLQKVGLQEKWLPLKADTPNIDHTNKFQTDMLEKKLRPGITGTKVSDSVMDTAKRSILNSPLFSIIVQQQIYRSNGVEPERSIPGIFTNPFVSGTAGNSKSKNMPVNSKNDTKIKSSQSRDPLTPTDLNYPSNTNINKKEKSIESSIGNEDISKPIIKLLRRDIGPSGNKHGDVTKKQVVGSTEFRNDRIGGGVVITGKPAGRNSTPPGNRFVFNKRKTIKRWEQSKDPEDRLPHVRGEKKLYTFKRPQRDNISTPPFGYNTISFNSFKPVDSPSVNNKFSAVSSGVVTGITQGNNTLLRHTDRKVIWRKPAVCGQNSGMVCYPENHNIQRDGGNSAIVRRVPVGSAGTIDAEPVSGHLNDQVTQLAGQTGGIDLNKIAEKVGRLLYKKLVIERERRGLGRWA